MFLFVDECVLTYETIHTQHHMSCHVTVIFAVVSVVMLDCSDIVAGLSGASA